MRYFVVLLMLLAASKNVAQSDDDDDVSSFPLVFGVRQHPTTNCNAMPVGVDEAPPSLSYVPYLFRYDDLSRKSTSSILFVDFLPRPTYPSSDPEGGSHRKPPG